MEKGNVLVIGNSGVGKSTLINAVLGEKAAPASWGIKETTQELKIYSGDDLLFNLVDTVGFEPSYSKSKQAIRAVKKWLKDAAKKGQEEKNRIDVVWFCVDGTSAKLFPETVKNVSTAISLWKSVPVIVVITKSYSDKERQNNIDMVNEAFAVQDKYIYLQGIVPVVADVYDINETTFVPPAGITELIDKTNELMPEGIRIADNIISLEKLNRRRKMAHSVAAASTAAAAFVGAAPIPFADAAILMPLETAELSAIAHIYDMDKEEKNKVFLDNIIKTGTVSVAVKAAISALKAIPGINIASAGLNSVIAGIIVFSIGEATIDAYEQVYLGKKTLDDVEWVEGLVSEKLNSKSLLETAGSILRLIGNLADKESIVSVISGFFKKNPKEETENEKIEDKTKKIETDKTEDKTEKIETDKAEDKTEKIETDKTKDKTEKTETDKIEDKTEKVETDKAEDKTKKTKTDKADSSEM